MIDWRSTVQALAYQRATAEAREQWQLREDESPPFNYRWEHVQQVVQLAGWLAGETGADEEIVAAAAWLHDICKVQPNHAEAGAREAAALLATTDYPTGKIDAVSTAIRQHAGLYRAEGAAPLEPLEAAVLWDADKLSKIGVQALLIFFSGQMMDGKTLHERRRQNDDFLLGVLSRTVSSMNTEPASELARRRYQANLDLQARWRAEELLEGE